jgi:Tol biopolymer transport system component
VVDYPAQLGSPNQLFRLQYPAGTLARLTNDPNDYVGVSVSASKAGLVTSRRDARMDVWLGDGEVSNGIVVVRRAPISIERLAWSDEHLLYGSVVGGRPAILRLTPSQSAPEELLLDAVAPGVTSDGRTVVFVTSSTDNILDLWKADGSGRRITKLASSVTASQVVVTPDDRSVIYSSIASGTVSIWTVPLEGGDPTKLADGAGASVSPDGASLAFTDSQAQLRVCRLPGCTAQHTIGSAPLDAPVAWAPDGRGVAYAIEGNVWVQPLGGGSPRQLTPSTDNRPIGSFAWSRDGKRLAITRSTVTNDIVSVQGLTR